jgi:2-polyprenyl-3-methyl-5-hydroxy-6-metoxy-1,4-benzoquinol methylase
MMRKRLRPMPSAEDLARLYATPHDHRHWQDHLYRVDVTSAMAHHMLPPAGTVADLSCGNAMIAKRLEQTHRARVILGDYAPGYEHAGPIEQTIHDIDRVDLFVCSETIEHLNDPDAVLRAIRRKTDRLILSTPDGEDNDLNPEHVWGWDAEAVREMLDAAGFIPDIHATVDTRPAGCVYSYQIWACH